MKALSYPMRLALRDIAASVPLGWADPEAAWVDLGLNDIPLVSVRALERRGLVESWLHYVRLTDAGREAARELKGDRA